MTRRRRYSLGQRLRYSRAVVRRFRVTVLLAGVLFGVVPWVFRALYRGPSGHGVSWGEAFHHVYFLMFGQPSLPYVDHALLEVLNLAIPPMAVAVVADGVVRFAYLFFARRQNDKEWIEVLSETLSGHVVVCGAGRIGYRVTTRLLDMGQDVVIIERREDGAFVPILRDLDVPVLIDDVKNPKALERVNVRGASAIVCATDDDLANLNAGLDARRVNPEIRVVLRLFDDDLGAKMRDVLGAEVLSSSALAAPAMAVAALDPRVIHSFLVGTQLMVVSEFHGRGPLVGMDLAAVRRAHGMIALSRRDARGAETLHPGGEVVVAAGDVLTLQGMYEDYCGLRARCGEGPAPRSGRG